MEAGLILIDVGRLSWGEWTSNFLLRGGVGGRAWDGGVWRGDNVELRILGLTDPGEGVGLDLGEEPGVEGG